MADADDDVLKLVDRTDVEGAIQLLMKRHGPAVYRYCQCELRDRSLADDVHQQVFIEAHRDLSRFSRASAIRLWLFGIAHHRVLDAIKKRRRQQSHIEHAERADAPDPSPLPGDTIDDARLLGALNASLAKLEDSVRSAVLLRFQQGFTYEEMAKICGEKAGTLHARVTRALPRLRELIEARLGPLD